MKAVVTSIGLKGLEGYRIQVEVQTKFSRRESIKIVGLPDASVRESKQRVASALYSSGYPLTGQKITINLSPSELRKNGPLYDLPMAIGILLIQKIITDPLPNHVAFLGVLSLDGTIQPANGMLAAILAAKKLDIKKLYIPYDENLPPLHFEKIEIVYVRSLQDCIDHLSGRPLQFSYPCAAKEKARDESPQIDFQTIIGHQSAKHALEVAAAGEHNTLMSGPPGSGKSLLAESFPSILPPLSKEASLEILSIYQLAGATIMDYTMPPFRNPHHSASEVSIIGGGQYPKPGEISLAHRGVLLLDEMAEFTRKTQEMLQQPLEKGVVTICRTRTSVSYPAAFILIGTMNNCPCGYAGEGPTAHYCVCTKKEILAYQNKLPGPIKDRFDIHLKLDSVNLSIQSTRSQESSNEIRKRVTEARDRQYHRYGSEITNSKVPFEVLLNDNPLTQHQLQNLQAISSKQNWSNRTQIKIIRLARTLSDLQQNNKISDLNIQAAIKLNGTPTS